MYFNCKETENKPKTSKKETPKKSESDSDSESEKKPTIMKEKSTPAVLPETIEDTDIASA